MNGEEVSVFLGRANPLDVGCEECGALPDGECQVTDGVPVYRTRPPHESRRRAVAGARVGWLSARPALRSLELFEVELLWRHRFDQLEVARCECSWDPA